MLKGGDISIQNYQWIYSDNAEFRIDAEYYRKEYLDIYSKLENTELLGNIVSMADVSTNGSFEYVQNILNDDFPKTIPYIRSGNVGNTFINKNELELISLQAHEKLPKSATKLNDVMMARKGKIGGASLITENEVGYNCNENVIKLTVKDSRFNPFYITAFYNCKYGLKQIERISTGNVQPWVSIFQIRKLKTSLASIEFQSEIELILKRSHQKLEQSKTVYQQAEALLSTTLNWKETNDDFLPNLNVNLKNLSQSFTRTGRLDAEFYQKKYENYKVKIESYPSGFTRVKDEYAQVKTKSNFNLASYKYVEIGDVNVSDGSYSFNEIATKELPANAKIMVKKGDILISTVRPNRGAITIIEHDRDDLIVSGAFTVLRKKVKSTFNNEFLKVLLRLDIYKDWLLQFNVGTSYPVIKDEDILSLIIPKVNEEIKTKIAEMIQQSNQLRSESNELIKKAKTAVELAIEHDEQFALNFLKEI